MFSSATVDDRCYQIAAPRTLAERGGGPIRACARIHADCLVVMRQSSGPALLDIGVFDAITEGANLLERKYPRAPSMTNLLYFGNP